MLFVCLVEKQGMVLDNRETTAKQNKTKPKKPQNESVQLLSLHRLQESFADPHVSVLRHCCSHHVHAGEADGGVRVPAEGGI